MRVIFPAFRRILAISIFALLSLAPSAAAQKVFTVAGGYVGDGKPAISAAFGYPTFAAFDPQGNLLIGDAIYCRIRKVDKQGIISTIAGTATCGFSGDGGPAIHAKISDPEGIAIDSAGDIFFVDQNNNRIRKVDSAGTITTVAGNGKAKYCGDGKPATKACLNYPKQLAVGSSRAGEVLYIADSASNRIRQVVFSTGIITTVAGNGTQGYSGDGGPAKKASLAYPEGVAFYGKTRTLWISDSSNAAIRQVDLKTGIITTFLTGTCSFKTITLCGPEGLVADASGNLHVADPFGNRVLRISVPEASVTLDAGVFWSGFNGDGIPANTALLNGPTDVILDSAGNVLTVDASNGRIRKGSGSQNITTFAGGYVGDGRLATSAALNFPANLAFDRVRNLYVADAADNRIRKVTPSGKISTFAGNGISGYSGDGGPAQKALLNSPYGVTADDQGNVFIGLVQRRYSQGGQKRHNHHIHFIACVSAVHSNGPGGKFVCG